jgi:protein-S-isoprenylcysteine O-methyltransferase Ste14
VAIPIIAIIIRLLWLSLEYPFVRRHRIVAGQHHDRGSAKLWDIANLLEPVGLVLGLIGIGKIESAIDLIRAIGLALLVTGIVIRFSAIQTLGKYFTSTVVIRNDHRLVRNGIYKYLRHPAYTGALLAHLGLGLSFSNWFSLAFSTIPYLAAAFYRMHVEDQVLREAFGDEYLSYAASTKRLIPKVY